MDSDLLDANSISAERSNLATMTDNATPLLFTLPSHDDTPTRGGSLLATMSCSASFSPCRRYRYDLWRRWADGPYAMFIGLNPSTADETQDDPTIRRCINFAKAWGYSALCMTNIFAFRATDPRDMKAEEFPIGGYHNDLALRLLSESAGVVIAAWGVHGTHLDRAADVVKLIPNLQCLGLSKDGHPRHPLYIKADCKPSPLNSVDQQLPRNSTT